MTDERKARLQKLQKQLKALTPEQRHELANRGIIATIEGRQLSTHNTILVYMQSNGRIPTIVGGYKQWKAAGHQVRKGEHGYSIWFPVGSKAKDDDEVEATENFYMGNVFDITQTEKEVKN